MTPQRMCIASAALLLLLVGCAAAPDYGPTPISIPSGPVPAYTPPKIIPAPAGVTCRAITDVERQAVRDYALSMKGKPTTAVDLGEGWSVVAFWFDPDTAPPMRLGIVTRGDRLNLIPDNWGGEVLGGAMRFEGGPTAYQAALDCIA